MNAIQLFTEGGKPLDIWCCSECKSLSLGRRDDGQLRNSREAAEECCTAPLCRFCEKPIEDWKTRHGMPQWHNECRNERDRQREIERLNEAIEMTDYAGFVYSDDISGYREGFFDDISDLLDHMDCDHVDDETGEPLPRPEFVFCCTPERHYVDVDRIIEDATSDGYEDMADNLQGVSELRAAVDAFNELNKVAMTSYHPDYKHKVRVPAAEPTPAS